MKILLILNRLQTITQKITYHFFLFYVGLQVGSRGPAGSLPDPPRIFFVGLQAGPTGQALIANPNIDVHHGTNNSPCSRSGGLVPVHLIISTSLGVEVKHRLNTLTSFYHLKHLLRTKL